MYDWSKFDIYLFINSSPKKVFQKWSTPTGLESFFVKSVEVDYSGQEQVNQDEAFKDGDGYQWEWFFNWKSSGKIQKVVPEKSVTFTFGKCIVLVEFLPHDSGTMLHLCQSGMENTEQDRVGLHLDCRCGWIYFLTNLKAVLEYGIDVRDKRVDTSQSLEVGFVPR